MVDQGCIQLLCKVSASALARSYIASPLLSLLPTLLAPVAGAAVG